MQKKVEEPLVFLACAIFPLAEIVLWRVWWVS